ncbi:MAG TPA: hypothetical protein VMB71_02775 [Acetobacteraceae bacterium]|nr:hypothetical protein [Acetobacteraceae bacterium]
MFTRIRRAVLGFSCLAVAFLAAAPAAAFHYGAASLPLDPIFNLPYDPATTHFEPFSISQLAPCQPLLGALARRGVRAKLFAAYANRGTRIVIVGDENPRAPRGYAGSMFILRAGGCKLSGPLFALRRTRVADPDLDPGLTAPQVAALMQDMLARYAAAFGGRANLLAWVDRLTAEAEAASAAPGQPCPCIYKTSFTGPMMRALTDFRRDA